MISLMENKTKWDKSKKNKNLPSIEIEINDTNYHKKRKYNEKTMEEVPIFQMWSSKQISSSPSHVKDHSTLHSGDCGIEYPTQASHAQQSVAKPSSSIIDIYEVPGPSTSRRYSSVYLHPDHARFNYSNTIISSSRDYNAMKDNEFPDGSNTLMSSNASSSTSVTEDTPAVAGNRGHGYASGRRRSSTWTGRYTDSADPEFANSRMVTRGSVGMHSLSDSLHKLTLTQSLAFPELARKLANRRRQEHLRATINDTSRDDFEACSKFVAVAGVFLLSLMVYGVVNKYGKV